MARKPITIFSWGYHGWGSATKQLVKAVDAVERDRGYQPPIFIDIRLKRQVRAAGFRDHAFENLLGPIRHRWMPKLGNRYIATHTGHKIQIDDPSAAEDLLDLAIEADKDGRRVIFFCRCQTPRISGKPACHRDRVTTLLLMAARKRKQPLQVVEWPGDQPKVIDLKISAKAFDELDGGKLAIPLGKKPDLARFARLTHGAIVQVHEGPDTLLAVTGPVEYRKGQWVLLWYWLCGEHQMAWAKKKATSMRRSFGLEPRK